VFGKSVPKGESAWDNVQQVRFPVNTGITILSAFQEPKSCTEKERNPCDIYVCWLDLQTQVKNEVRNQPNF
jgi:hypothetical protein